MPIRASLCLPLFALAACQAADGPAGEGAAKVSAADRALIATGLPADQIVAARAYLKPFTTADQGPCFDDVALRDVGLKGKEAVPAAVPVTRVVIAVDGSGSMAGRVGSRTKLDLARDATQAFVADLPATAEAAVLSFGQRGDNTPTGKAASCTGIDLLAPMARDRTRLTSAVADMKAVGWTPLAAGLERAEALLAASQTSGEQVIYVVSDGEETCGGDPVAVARRINTGTTRAIVNIVGFGLPSGEAAKLQQVAGAGGGRFVNVTDDAEYRRTVAAIRESNRRNVNRIAASAATTVNTIDTGGATTRAALCTGAIVTRETLAVGADLTRRDLAKTPGPQRNVVFAVLKQRHDAMAARRDAYTARLTGARDAANAQVDAREKAAR